MTEKKNLDWKFDTEDVDTYLLKIKIKAEGKLVNKIWGQVKQKYEKRKGKIAGDISSIDEIDIPPQFLNLLRIAIRKPLRGIFEDVGADGINCLNNKVSKANFVRNKENKDDWDINIDVTGDFSDER